jgi:hypothetical protein
MQKIESLFEENTVFKWFRKWCVELPLILGALNGFKFADSGNAKLSRSFLMWDKR